MRIPEALIRKVCYPTSYRLPKLNRLSFPKVRAVPTARTERPILPLFDRRIPPVITAVNYGNISNDQYRYFCGYADTRAVGATCRWCDKRLYSEQMRKGHFKESPECQTQLLCLYRLLRDDKNCVVCEKRTRHTPWGVPLCSTDCVAKWRFMLPDVFLFERNRLKGAAHA